MALACRANNQNSILSRVAATLMVVATIRVATTLVIVAAHISGNQWDEFSLNLC